jgi:hypothetical protein
MAQTSIVLANDANQQLLAVDGAYHAALTATPSSSAVTYANGRCVPLSGNQALGSFADSGEEGLPECRA